MGSLRLPCAVTAIHRVPTQPVSPGTCPWLVIRVIRGLPVGGMSSSPSPWRAPLLEAWPLGPAFSLPPDLPVP